jgi:hypothetical protein
MSPFDATPQRRGTTNPRSGQETTTTPTNLVDELLQPRSHASLARGIVWADILADIAADDEARQMRDAA